MHTKPVYQLDGRNFSTLQGFYAEISRVLIPRAAWGNNLDAFNDVLRGGFGTPDGGFVLRWIYSGLSRDRLGHRETARQLELRLASCYPANRSHVQAELNRARQGEGSTVFDWLVEIIRDHGEGGSEAENGVELELHDGA